MYFKTVVNFYVQNDTSGDELCLSVCQVQIMTDTHTKHTHSHTRTAHITQLVTIKVQNRSVGYNGQKKQKKTFKCSEGERLVPLEFGALVCEI